MSDSGNSFPAGRGSMLERTLKKGNIEVTFALPRTSRRAGTNSACSRTRTCVEWAGLGNMLSGQNQAGSNEIAGAVRLLPVPVLSTSIVRRSDPPIIGMAPS